MGPVERRLQQVGEFAFGAREDTVTSVQALADPFVKQVALDRDFLALPDMLGSISHALGRRKINIHNMLNKSKGEMAYTLVDTDAAVPAQALDELGKLHGVLAVRYLPVDE